MQQDIPRVLEDAAETNGLVRPVLKKALTANQLTPYGQHVANGATNYWDYWENRFGPKFFDMATFIRLGTAVEMGLRNYYMRKKGHANLVALRADNNVKHGIFQRISPTANNGAVELFRNEIGVELTKVREFGTMEEVMLQRHLYAHNAGLLDDEFIEKWRTLTGEDLDRDQTVVASGYPAADIYWFRPLNKLGEYIEAARNFFTDLPQ